MTLDLGVGRFAMSACGMAWTGKARGRRFSQSGALTQRPAPGAWHMRLGGSPSFYRKYENVNHSQETNTTRADAGVSGDHP